MEPTQLKLERAELYRQVWSKPMIHLAKEYGLSDNGLRKICKRYEIPLPNIGHWQRIQYGKIIKPPALPKFDGNSSILINITEKEAPLPVEPEFQKKIQEKIAQEYLSQNRIIISDSSEKFHPLVEQVKKNSSESYRYRECIDSHRGYLDIRVGRTSMNRSLNIMDALAKALEARDISVFIKSSEYKSSTCIKVMGEIFTIDLRESLTRIKVKDDPYSSFEFKPNGKLFLRLKSEWGSHIAQLSDGKKQKLEDCLNDFVIKLYKEALCERGRRLKEEKERREREERERKEETARRLREQELKRIKDLESEVFNWCRSRDIRSYIKFAEKAYVKRNGSVRPGGEFAKWKKWAIEQTDRLDPIHNNRLIFGEKQVHRKR